MPCSKHRPSSCPSCVPTTQADAIIDIGCRELEVGQRIRRWRPCCYPVSKQPASCAQRASWAINSCLLQPQAPRHAGPAPCLSAQPLAPFIGTLPYAILAGGAALALQAQDMRAHGNRLPKGSIGSQAQVSWVGRYGWRRTGCGSRHQQQPQGWSTALPLTTGKELPDAAICTHACPHVWPHACARACPHACMQSVMERIHHQPEPRAAQLVRHRVHAGTLARPGGLWVPRVVLLGAHRHRRQAGPGQRARFCWVQIEVPAAQKLHRMHTPLLHPFTCSALLIPPPLHSKPSRLAAKRLSPAQAGGSSAGYWAG